MSATDRHGEAARAARKIRKLETHTLMCDSDLRRQKARVARLRRALKPFAKEGLKIEQRGTLGWREAQLVDPTLFLEALKAYGRKSLVMALLPVLLLATACSSSRSPWAWPAVPAHDILPPSAAFSMGSTGELTGQAFLRTRAGAVKPAAGREVTLDPVTRLSKPWWDTCARDYHCHPAPAPDAFMAARRTTVADADGRFRFERITPGRYYVRTEVTWSATIGYALRVPIKQTQGGVVADEVAVYPDKTTEVVLTWR
ncbi:MAG: hypothetical protein EPN91_02155 [Salinibacterium sp.]|nr:MAG: hypothetical protein EPN91_02155 [Salinibacterium sp.]